MKLVNTFSQNRNTKKRKEKKRILSVYVHVDTIEDKCTFDIWTSWIIVYIDKIIEGMLT